MHLEFPLANLIKSRSSELGLDAESLGARLGYRNPAKAAGRVIALCQGNIFSLKSRSALARLAAALELSDDVIQEATQATEQLLAEIDNQAREHEIKARAAAEVLWRANFKPHAVIDTKNQWPSQITMCGMTGGSERWLVIRLDASQQPVSFIQQVQQQLPSKLRTSDDGSKFVVFYGKALGFFINYSPDHAVRYNLEGEPLDVLSQAYRPGQVFVR